METTVLDWTMKEEKDTSNVHICHQSYVNTLNLIRLVCSSSLLKRYPHILDDRGAYLSRSMPSIIQLLPGDLLLITCGQSQGCLYLTSKLILDMGATLIQKRLWFLSFRLYPKDEKLVVVYIDWTNSNLTYKSLKPASGTVQQLHTLKTPTNALQSPPNKRPTSSIICTILEEISYVQAF